MNILNMLAAYVSSPATGDQFPIVPIIIVGGIAVVIAIVTAVAAVFNKKGDDDKK